MVRAEGDHRTSSLPAQTPPSPARTWRKVSGWPPSIRTFPASPPPGCRNRAPEAHVPVPWAKPGPVASRIRYRMLEGFTGSQPCELDRGSRGWW